MFDRPKELDEARALYFQATDESLRRAAERYEELTREAESDARPWAGLAQVRCVQADLSAGDEAAQRALLGEAAALVKKARKRDRNALETRRALGHVELVSHRFDEAFEVLSSVLRDHPDDAETGTLVYCCAPGGRDPSDPVLSDAIVREPRLVRAFLDACYGFVAACGPRRMPEAARRARVFVDRVGPAVLEQGADNQWVRLGMGILAALLRNFEETVRWGRLVFPGNPEDGNLLCGAAETLGHVALESGDSRLAAALFRTCHEIDPEDHLNTENEIHALSRFPSSVDDLERAAGKFVALASDKPDKRGAVMRASEALSRIRAERQAGVLAEFRRVFFSYPHAAHAQVMEVVDELIRVERSAGSSAGGAGAAKGWRARVFMDQTSLEPGLPWEAQIAPAIREHSDAVVLFHSTHVLESPYVRAEIDEAFVSLDPSRVIVVDMDGTYVPRRDESVLPRSDAGQVAAKLHSMVCAMERRPVYPAVRVGFPRLSADVYAVGADRWAAQGVERALHQRGIQVLRNIILDEDASSPGSIGVPAAASVVLVSRESLGVERWREVAGALFERGARQGHGSFVPVLLDGTYLPSPWGTIHALDLRRFQGWRHLLNVLACKLSGEEIREELPELPAELSEP